MSFNDDHVAKHGSALGGCIDAPDGPEWFGPIVREEVELRVAIHGQLMANRDLACHGCIGQAPGCCYQLVSITSWEAFVIVHGYPALVSANWERLVAAADEEQRVIGVAELNERSASDPDPGGARRGAFMARGKPCPFLTVEGRCGIYKLRPHPCATYATVTPPSKCAPDPGGGQEVGMLDARSGLDSLAVWSRDRALRAGIPLVVYIGLATGVVKMTKLLEAKRGTEVRDASR